MNPGMEGQPSSPLFPIESLRDVILLESVRSSEGGSDLESDVKCQTPNAISLQQLEDAIDQADADEDLEHHHHCWRRYLRKHLTPQHWRGKRDVFQYERLIADLIEFRRVMRYGRTQARVRLSEWLRDRLRRAQRSPDPRRAIAHVRREVRSITDWYAQLQPGERADLCDSYRAESRQREREDRLIKRLNSRFRGQLFVASSRN